MGLTLHGTVAVIKFDPPSKVIAINRPFIAELNELILKCEQDDAVKVVIITGRGSSFAAGADVKELNTFTSKSMFVDDQFERDCWKMVYPFRKPLIAAVSGLTFGGGLETAMMADIMLCTENTLLGQPEINLALVPGCGGAVRLANKVGKSKAMEMLLTGDPIGAQDALKWGLVNKIYPDYKTMMAGAMELAQKIATKSMMAAGYTKRAIKQTYEVSETAALAHERSLFFAVLNTHDKGEGTKAFIEKRKPQFKDE